MVYVDAVVESGRNPVEHAPDSARVWGVSRLARGTGRPNLSSETKSSGANGDRGKTFFPVCLADHDYSRIGN